MTRPVHLRLTMLTASLLASLSLAAFSADPTALPVQFNNGVALNQNNLFVVANLNDPTSVTLAQDYMAARHIPTANLIQVRLPVRIEISSAEAAPLQTAIAAAGKARGFALAWSMPYRVGPNQSVTSYVTLGPVSNSYFTTVCNETPTSTYYDTGSSRGTPNPTLLSLKKPAMLLASYTSYNPTVPSGQAGRYLSGDNLGTTTVDSYLAGIRATIKQGIAADHTWPKGTGYFLNTSDNTRSAPRRYSMQQAVSKWGGQLGLQYLNADTLGGKTDILLYETGKAYLDPSEGGRNQYLPGAIADTLTSYAGRLYDSNGQVSALEFLRAGATASFGTVREPCAFGNKFPAPELVTKYLLAGDTIAEAYWKSVQWPTEGLFIGEPLARPFGKMRAPFANGEVLMGNLGAEDGYYDIYNGRQLLGGSILLKQNATSYNLGNLNTATGTPPQLQVTLRQALKPPRTNPNY